MTFRSDRPGMLSLVDSRRKALSIVNLPKPRTRGSRESKRIDLGKNVSRSWRAPITLDVIGAKPLCKSLLIVITMVW